MDLFILRHGKAEDAGRGLTDAKRRLTKKGQEDIAAVAEWMVSQGLQFDRIAASPLDRAQETAAIVAERFSIPERLESWDVLVPGGDPAAVCREIGRYPEDSAILLVGHEPLLSSLIGRIISGETGAGIVMTKGALAKIRDFSSAEHPSGELHWLLMAKQMAGTRH